MKKPNTNKLNIVKFNKNFLPIEAIRMIAKWEFIQKSPYSLSLYDKPKDWNDALPDTIRIADHWNFFCHGRMHCETSINVPNHSHWVIAKFDADIRKFVPFMLIKKRPQSIEDRVEIIQIYLQLELDKIAQESKKEELCLI